MSFNEADKMLETTTTSDGMHSIYSKKKSLLNTIVVQLLVVFCILMLFLVIKKVSDTPQLLKTSNRTPTICEQYRAEKYKETEDEAEAGTQKHHRAKRVCDTQPLKKSDSTATICGMIYNDIEQYRAETYEETEAVAGTHKRYRANFTTGNLTIGYHALYLCQEYAFDGSIDSISAISCAPNSAFFLYACCKADNFFVPSPTIEHGNKVVKIPARLTNAAGNALVDGPKFYNDTIIPNQQQLEGGYKSIFYENRYWGNIEFTLQMLQEREIVYNYTVEIKNLVREKAVSNYIKSQITKYRHRSDSTNRKMLYIIIKNYGHAYSFLFDYTSSMAMTLDTSSSNVDDREVGAMCVFGNINHIEEIIKWHIDEMTEERRDVGHKVFVVFFNKEKCFNDQA